jgi:hypothetical protein
MVTLKIDMTALENILNEHKCKTESLKGRVEKISMINQIMYFKKIKG